MNIKEDRILEDIRVLRAQNNDFWLGLVRIALRDSPEETKGLLRAISVNDRAITKLTENLTDDQA